MFQEIQKISSNKINFDQQDTNSKKIEQNLTENTKDQKTSAFTKEVNNVFNKEIIEPQNFDKIKESVPKVFSVRKRKKIFKTIKGGRPCKNVIKIKNFKKGKYRKGNALPKIINSCKKNIYKFLLFLIPRIELDEPNITNKNKSHDYWRSLMNKNIYEVFCNALPKRTKGDTDIKENGEKRSKKKQELYENKDRTNKKEIDRIIQDEKFYIIFKALLFKDFLDAYLKNKKEIVKNHEKYGRIIIPLKGFETYSQSFNFEYTAEQKEIYKNHVFTVMNPKD